jgi:hypothetical protein
MCIISIAAVVAKAKLVREVSGSDTEQVLEK